MKPGQHLYPSEGIHIWKNEKNGFVVFELHYKADPQKRDPAYIKQVKDGMPIRRFKQEYELVWDSFEGLPVFSDWDQGVHGVKVDIAPHIGLPLLVGFDFGLTPAAIVCQLQENTLFVLREYTQVNMGAKRFMAWLVPQLKVHYPLFLDHQKDYLCFIDPSGHFRKDTDESTCAQVIADSGFTQIIPGPIAWEERRGSVETWLTRRTLQGPCLQVSLPNCPILVRGFQGGYRYPEKSLETEPNQLRPRKDIHSHIHDALQMVCSRILVTKPTTTIHVPALSYSWSNR